MTPSSSHKATGHSGIAHALQVLRRRKFLVLQALIIMPVVAFLASHSQQATYQATSEVLLSTDKFAQTISGTGSDVYLNPEREVATQAQVASAPEVARRTLTALKLRDRTARDLTKQTTIVGNPSANLLTFTVKDHDRAMATRIAGEYARQFIAYRGEIDTAAVDAALSEVRQNLKGVPFSSNDTSLYQRLVQSEQQLRTLRALQTSNAFLVAAPEDAAQTGPRPWRNAALAFVLALVVGTGIALAAESLDTRVRSADEVDHDLGYRMLGRIPALSKRLTAGTELAMFAEPLGAASEAYRLVATNLEFVMGQREVRSVLVTSSIEQEGKSTTAANLAVALARAGKRVILVDLDMRRPRLHRMLESRFPLHGALVGHPGVTDVLLERVDIDDALVWIDPRPNAAELWDEASDVAEQATKADENQFGLLVAGAALLDPGEVVSSSALRELLSALGSMCDIVVIDAPPLLRSGDTIALASQASSVLLVARVGRVRKPMLREIRRILNNSPANILGFVTTGEAAGPTYGGYYGEARQQRGAEVSQHLARSKRTSRQA